MKLVLIIYIFSFVLFINININYRIKLESRQLIIRNTNWQNQLNDKYLHFLAPYSNSIEKLWKDKICLLIRTFHGDADILPSTILSTTLFWDDSIGEKSLIFDEHEEKYQYLVQGTAFHFFTEKFDSQITSGYVRKQWSNFYPEKYCQSSSKYVAISDSDAIFSTYVTPDLLFNSSGFPNMQVSTEFQKHLWLDDLKILNTSFQLNGMVKLPFLIQKEHVLECRHYIENTFQQNFSQILMKYPKFCFMSIMATYVYIFHRNQYNFIFTEIDEPLLQYAIHLPYTPYFPVKKHSTNYIKAASIILLNGICYTPFFTDEKCLNINKSIPLLYQWQYSSLKWNKHDNFAKYHLFHLKNLTQLFQEKIQ